MTLRELLHARGEVRLCPTRIEPEPDPQAPRKRLENVLRVECGATMLDVATLW